MEHKLKLSKNFKLNKAKKVKFDEFYTQYSDIENELQYYKPHFENKIVYCNTDDPLCSNFYKYFVNNFETLKLKKVIASCYKKIDLLSGTSGRGYYYEYEGKGKKFPDKEDVKYFKGSGDFRSAECIELLKQADIVVTNPPFSLFREFLNLMFKYDKKFLVMGPVLATKSVNILEKFRDNKIWMGINYDRHGISNFIVPDTVPPDKKDKIQYDDKGQRTLKIGNVGWFTNLKPEAERKKLVYTQSYFKNKEKYQKFDNFDAINIDKLKNIPYDYDGIMAVPVTFMFYYDYNEYEIIGDTHRIDKLIKKEINDKYLLLNGKRPFVRIFIKKRARR